MNKFNNFMAEKLATYLSSMWLFWALCLVLIITTIISPPVGLQAWILFWVSIFFQGVALPVLGFVSDIQAKKMQQLLDETHQEVLEELKELKEIHEELKQLLNEREGDK